MKIGGGVRRRIHTTLGRGTDDGSSDCSASSRSSILNALETGRTKCVLRGKQIRDLLLIFQVYTVRKRVSKERDSQPKQAPFHAGNGHNIGRSAGSRRGDLLRLTESFRFHNLGRRAAHHNTEWFAFLVKILDEVSALWDARHGASPPRLRCSSAAASVPTPRDRDRNQFGG